MQCWDGERHNDAAAPMPCNRALQSEVCDPHAQHERRGAVLKHTYRLPALLDGDMGGTLVIGI